MPRPAASSQANAEWAHHAAAVLREHGAVSGNEVYEARHQARYQAQKLRSLMVQFGLYQHHSLREHTEAREDGWGWTVDFVIR